MSLENLYHTLHQRKRPEDVAQLVVETFAGKLSRHEARIIDKAAKNALVHRYAGYTSMAQTFAGAVGAEVQVKTATELFALEQKSQIDTQDSEDIGRFIAEVSPLIRKEVGANNFKNDRLNHAERKAAGLDLSKRAYNKRWRMLKRLERKRARFDRETLRIELQKTAKHGLAHTLTFEEFSKDENSACFIAYYTARSNLRSTFTNQSQERPYDEICDMLLQRCRGTRVQSTLRFWEKSEAVAGDANWWAIAHTYVSPDVLAELTDEQKGRLLGEWTAILETSATLLGELWVENDFNRETMIVRRGNDSSTWNHVAGAWNKARDNWMQLIYALGMDYLLDTLCFGKVLRLMAGDVAHWHRATGGGLDPNTQVWNKVPLPWEVFREEAHCTRHTVIEACRAAGLDPEKSGWVAPRTHGIATFRPTPELVHGVTVGNPYLATVLKRHKYFSGKAGATAFDPEQN